MSSQLGDNNSYTQNGEIMNRHKVVFMQECLYVCHVYYVYQK